MRAAETPTSNVPLSLQTPKQGLEVKSLSQYKRHEHVYKLHEQVAICVSDSMCGNFEQTWRSTVSQINIFLVAEILNVEVCYLSVLKKPKLKFW